jgi:nucleotide-binding universal stress UspA family protein
MFRKTIVAVDGEAGGFDASALARTLAPPTAEVVACRVVARDDAPQGVADAGDDEAVTAARRVIDASPRLSSTGVLVHARSVAGGLHRLAEEQSADLIVVGSHHRGGTARLWSGDRTRATLRDAPCAVAVAPRDFAEDPRALIRSIGVGYDETEEAQRALAMGRALAWDTGAELQALEVVPATNWQTPDSGAGWKAAAAGERLVALEGVTGVVVEGDVHGHLAHFAREVDVLILGSHHHGALRRLVLGDTAGIAGHLACAVIVMPYPAPGDRPGA